VGRGVKGTGGLPVGAAVKGVSKLGALGPLRGLGGGEHLLDPAIGREEVD